VDVELHVDEKEIPLNKFLKRLFSGIVTGAVMPLRNIEEDWKEIRIKVIK